MGGANLSENRSDTRTPRLSGWSLDATVTALSVLMVSGVALDFRSHAAGISFEEEGFFTPEHVFFYSMFLAVAATIGLATYQHRRAGADWVDAVPTGYWWGVVGVLLFGLGGAGDYLWHNAFGFEEGFEALVSPSHLTLVVGASLFLASPLRAAWYRDDTPSGFRTLPAVVSAGLVATAVALIGLYLNPLVEFYANRPGEANVVLGVVSLMTFPLILVGTALALVRRFDLPTGALTATFAIVALSSAVVRGYFHLALPVLVAGLVADGLVLWRPPRPVDRRALRVFTAVVPAVFVAGYLAVVAATNAIPWAIHVWAGTPFLAASAGLLLSYVVAPGPEPGEGGREA